MSQKTLRAIHLVYGILLAVLLFFTAGCFIGSCIAIYNSGSRPFSRESIALAFDSISLPVYLLIIGIAGGALLSLLLPVSEKKEKALRNDLDTLRRLQKKLGGNIPSRESRLRLALRIGTTALSFLLAIYPALLLLDPSRFTLKDVNGSVIAAVIPALIWAGIVIALCTVSSFLCERSIKREVALCKAALAEGADLTSSCASSIRSCPLSSLIRKHERGVRLMLRVILAIAAITFILLGVWNGGAADVLGKAIRICTECIGLG